MSDDSDDAMRRRKDRDDTRGSSSRYGDSGSERDQRRGFTTAPRQDYDYETERSHHRRSRESDISLAEGRTSDARRSRDNDSALFEGSGGDSRRSKDYYDRDRTSESGRRSREYNNSYDGDRNSDDVRRSRDRNSESYDRSADVRRSKDSNYDTYSSSRDVDPESTRTSESRQSRTKDYNQWGSERSSAEQNRWEKGETSMGDSSIPWTGAKERELPPRSQRSSGNKAFDRESVVVENYVDSDSDGVDNHRPIKKVPPSSRPRPIPPSNKAPEAAFRIAKGQKDYLAIESKVEQRLSVSPVETGPKFSREDYITSGNRNNVKKDKNIDEDPPVELDDYGSDNDRENIHAAVSRSAGYSHPGIKLPRQESTEEIDSSTFDEDRNEAVGSPKSYFSRNSHNSSDTRTGSKNETKANASLMDKMMERTHGGSFVLTAHENGVYTDMVQCVIMRDKSSVGMDTCYNLYLEDGNKLLIYAQKRALCRTANYQFFDMTRGLPGKTLSKKSGNFVGKLRAQNLAGTEYILVSSSHSEKEEISAIVYDQIGFLDQIKEGSQPRRMTVMCPTLDSDAVPVPNRTSEVGGISLIDQFKRGQTGKMFVFGSKEPKFENGNYRLNFHGRVSVPSVKNFQLVSQDEPEHVVCQFGKIGDDKFHLDFKAPFTALQAFAAALTQFNL